MREKIERIVRWASMILGILILGSCSVMGGLNYGWPFGLLGFLGGFLGGALIVGISLGWLYSYFLLRRDLKSINAEIEKLRASPPPDPAQR